MNARRKKTKLPHPWLRLIRLPNQFTVPGDVLAGCTIGLTGFNGDRNHLAAALASAVFLYTAGLIMNDLADAGTDARERPDRPLPSGAVSKRAASFATALLLGCALVLAGLAGGALLAAAASVGCLLFLYNTAAKRHRLAGSLVMGLCRAGSLLMGAASVSAEALVLPETLLTAGWWFAYIASVSWIASREMNGHPFGLFRWSPLVIVAAGAAGLGSVAGVSSGPSLFRAGFCFMFAMLLCYQSAVFLATRPGVRLPSGRVRTIDTGRIYPRAVGVMISALIPMQAGVLILHADRPLLLLAALMILLFWPLSRLAARYVPAS